MKYQSALAVLALALACSVAVAQDIMTTTPVGGNMTNVPVGGAMSANPVGGAMAPSPVGDATTIIPVVGIIAVIPVEGFITVTPVENITLTPNSTQVTSFANTSNWNFTEIRPEAVADNTTILGLLEFGSLEVIKMAIAGLDIHDHEFNVQVHNVSSYEYSSNLTFYQFIGVFNNTDNITIEAQYIVRFNVSGERDLFKFQYTVNYPGSAVRGDDSDEEMSSEWTTGENDEFEFNVEFNLDGENEWADFELNYDNDSNSQEAVSIIVYEWDFDTALVGNL